MEEQQKRKRDLASVFFVIITGGLLMGNLFEALPWNIWEQGVILVGIAFVINIFYRFLYRKGWAHTLCQVLIFTLTFTLLSHTFLTITKPNYLKATNQDLLAEDYFYELSELRAELFPEIQAKILDIVIENYSYNITDSTENLYYFKMHPPQKPGIDAFISYRKIDNNLKIEFHSKRPELSYLQKILAQNPNFVLGQTQIPANIDISVDNWGELDFKLEHQKVSNFVGLFNDGKSTVNLSRASLPTSRFLITVRGAEVDLNLPKELGHKIKYSVKDIGELNVEGQRIRERGDYSILSTGEENPCEIEIIVDSGKLNVTLY